MLCNSRNKIRDIRTSTSIQRLYFPSPPCPPPPSEHDAILGCSLRSLQYANAKCNTEQGSNSHEPHCAIWKQSVLVAQHRAIWKRFRSLGHCVIWSGKNQYVRTPNDVSNTEVTVSQFVIPVPWYPIICWSDRNYGWGKRDGKANARLDSELRLIETHTTKWRVRK